ncbi:hypothetical protein HUJ04_007859 [Dendroctonus ponderosae]|nr:hypothetical protein HUJ04_007859 [Dendroctonus ponderosae]
MDTHFMVWIRAMCILNRVLIIVIHRKFDVEMQESVIIKSQRGYSNMVHQPVSGGRESTSSTKSSLLSTLAFGAAAGAKVVTGTSKPLAKASMTSLPTLCVASFKQFPNINELFDHSKSLLYDIHCPLNLGWVYGVCNFVQASRSFRQCTQSFFLGVRCDQYKLGSLFDTTRKPVSNFVNLHYGKNAFLAIAQRSTALSNCSLAMKYWAHLSIKAGSESASNWVAISCKISNCWVLNAKSRALCNMPPRWYKTTAFSKLFCSSKYLAISILSRLETSHGIRISGGFIVEAHSFLNLASGFKVSGHVIKRRFIRIGFCQFRCFGFFAQKTKNAHLRINVSSTCIDFQS